MATRAGEEVVATLFADIHYFYGTPGSKPPHHRFDKGSYVYLFENAAQRRARIEVANNAGTSDQDAFDGYLDGAHVQYSYRHGTLVTVTAEGPNGQRTTPVDIPEWHLAAFDPRNENKYMYKLHTADIYFWTKEDALVFVNEIRRVLPQQQITILDEPSPPPPVEDMSAVVQKLENVAISDPSYQQGRTRDSRTTTTATTTSFAGPPISATPQSQEASNYAPLAYNPAAPAAPETIQYREKTPPPEDGAGNPLMMAAASDQGQTYGGFQQPGFPGPPQHQQSYFPTTAPPSQFSQPAPSIGLSSPGLSSPYAQNFQSSFLPPPSTSTPTNLPPAAPVSAPPSYQSQQNHQGMNVPVTQYASYPTSIGSSPGISTPGIYSPGLSAISSPSFQPGLASPSYPSQQQQQQPLASPPYQPQSLPPYQQTQTQLPPPPPGGFSTHTYTPSAHSSLSNTQPLMTDYSIHEQVYRPTESEAIKKLGKQGRAPTGKLEQRAGQLERGVGSLFKKLEKKIG